jgi:hypothetical protein
MLHVAKASKTCSHYWETRMQRVDVSVKPDIMSGEWGLETPGMGDADNSTHPCIEHIEKSQETLQP